MAVSIFYVSEYPGLVNAGDVSVNMLPAVPIQTQMVLATVGGAATFTLTSRGSALTSGTYTIKSLDASTTTGAGFTFVAGVSSTGQMTTLTAINAGYSFKVGDTIGIPLGIIGTASSILTTVTIATVVPCSAPFNPATNFVELGSDGGPAGTALFGSTVTTAFLPLNILSTQQALTSLGVRLNTNERIVRGVRSPPVVALGVPPAYLQVGGIGLQVIMGTAVS